MLTVLLNLYPELSSSTEAANQTGRFLGAKETVYPAWFKESFLDIREDISEAADGEKRLLLFFHQNGCPYCNLMVERNLSQVDIAQQMREQLDVIEINMWGDREVLGIDGSDQTEKSFAAGLRVQFTPTLLFLDESGKVVLRLNGYIPPASFKVALDYVTQRKEKELSYRDYLARNRPAKSSGKLIAEPYFSPAPFDLSKPGGPLAVFFEQRHCPNCERLHNEVLSDPSVSELVRQFRAVQLDIWSDTPVVTPGGEKSSAREWARSLNIAFAPSILLFDPEGREVIRSEAYFKRFHTASIFDYLLSGGYKHEPSFQRYLSERAEAIRARGEDVDIWR